MRRPPNLSISRWFAQNGLLNRPWVREAPCSQRLDLPWVDNARPTPHDELRMASVCFDCPVLTQCAEYALTTAGGFYAGVWIPWRTADESADVRLVRTNARRHLRNLIEPARRQRGRPRAAAR